MSVVLLMLVICTPSLGSLPLSLFLSPACMCAMLCRWKFITSYAPRSACPSMSTHSILHSAWPPKHKNPASSLAEMRNSTTTTTATTTTTVQRAVIIVMVFAKTAGIRECRTDGRGRGRRTVCQATELSQRPDLFTLAQFFWRPICVT